jgi:peptide/nickel transport system permease protein
MLSFMIGGTLGVLTALKRGWLDQGISRIVDAFLAIPVLIFALMLLAVFGKSIWMLILILALLDSTRVFRLARATALNVVVMDYVEAAKLRGEGMGWIIFKEVLPNILPPMITEFGLRFCFVFLTISHSHSSASASSRQPPTGARWWPRARRSSPSRFAPSLTSRRPSIPPLPSRS